MNDINNMSQEQFTNCFFKALMDERLQNCLKQAFTGERVDQNEGDHKENPKYLKSTDTQANFEVKFNMITTTGEPNQ